jgi:hypothetical protein
LELDAGLAVRRGLSSPAADAFNPRPSPDAYGRPTGALGTLGGIIMARTNAAFACSLMAVTRK